ncbi:MARVEL domain-containing protein 1-like [Sabethes cyaneus]|uniref:MARVEL domain-containing protein 1-like n=1 Tax=Sabethes cyaneus TaxID=53552 RepID=UPI00237E058A|nr:MARVEL domain-containing protein 1-like [Sabethes cyaneus]
MMQETVVTVGQPQVTPTINPAATQSSSVGLRFNIGYFTRPSGILKVIQIIFGIICMACATPVIAGTGWFMFVAIFSFICTVLWSFAHLFGIREAISPSFNWGATELFNTAFIVLIYFIAFIVQLALWANLTHDDRSRNLAAGSFGIFNFLAYVAGLYFLYLEYS